MHAAKHDNFLFRLPQITRRTVNPSGVDLMQSQQIIDLALVVRLWRLLSTVLRQHGARVLAGHTFIFDVLRCRPSWRRGTVNAVQPQEVIDLVIVVCWLRLREHRSGTFPEYMLVVDVLR